MTSRHGNLLTEPCFAVREDSGVRQKLTLPGVLAALSRAAPIEFARVRPYQEQAWYCFLVQLAAFTQDRVPDAELWPDERSWTNALRSLTDGDEAWTLVVPDLTKPAFLQPPVPENDLSALKNGPICEPDDVAMDVLFTGRSHDIKPRRVVHPSDESWVHALLLVQTLSGFGGKSNYGIARMNGAYSSRPQVSIAGPWSERFRRDVPLWSNLGTHESLFDRKQGIGLTWRIPWNGDTVLLNAQLHPAHIEICRRIRLLRANDETVAFRTGTKKPRTDKSERDQLNGNLGCIWTPVLRAKGTPLTVKGGFSYRGVHGILFSGDWELPLSLSALSSTSADVEFRALEGGQGETGGFHVRRVPVPESARRRVQDWSRVFGERSRTQLALVEAVEKKVLRHAVAVLLQGDPESVNFKDERIRRVAAVFDKLVDEQFFMSLFRDPEAYAEDHARWWSEELRSLSLRVLRDAQASLPIPDSRRERALAASDAIFFAGVAKHLPALAGGNNDQPT